MTLDRSNAKGQKVQEYGSLRRPVLFAAILLTCLVWAVFFPVLGFEFVDLDTPAQVVNNPHIQGLTAENLKHIFTSWCLKSYYPVRTLTYAVDYQVWGLNPTGFKLTGGLIHTASVLLVFWLVLRLFRHPAAPGKSSEAWWDVAVATFSAGVFAVHPVVVEPVAWVPGREELLMTLGALGCMHLHLAARRLGEKTGNTARVLACHAGAAFCCAVACLSNAVAAVIPLLVTAWDVLTLTRFKWRRIVYGTSALWVIGGVTIVLKRLGGNAETAALHAVFSAEWIMILASTYWQNLTTLFWPTELAAHYASPFLEDLPDATVLLGGMAIGLTGVILWMLRRKTLALFGLVWFCLALAPTSQIMPHHIVRADRFFYLPLVGLVVAAAMGLRPLGPLLKGRAVVASVMVTGVLGLLLLGTLSARQLRTWRDSVSLWENSLRVDPSNAFAHSCLADNMAKNGQYDRAILHYEIALRIHPDHAETLGDFGWFLATCGDLRLRDYARAVGLAEQACAITDWKNPRILHKYAVVRCSYADHLAGRGEFRLAIESYRKAIEADPNYDLPRFNLALLLATCTDARLRQPEIAVRLAEQGCALIEQPDAHRLLILAAAYAEAGRFAMAAATAEKAIPLAQAAGDRETVDDLRLRSEYYRRQALSGGACE